MNQVKLISCGILVYDNNLNFLSIYPYGGNGAQWNIPKGMQEKDESFYETAIREFKEETNINIFDFVKDVEYKGIFNYNKYKDLVIFSCKSNKLKNMVSICKCVSEFKCDGNYFPEIIEFKVLNIKKDSNIIYPKLLNIIDSFL